MDGKQRVCISHQVLENALVKEIECVRAPAVDNAPTVPEPTKLPAVAGRSVEMIMIVVQEVQRKARTRAGSVKVPR